MALMWPRKIPPDVRSNPLRAAEIEVYERLQTQLDEGWWVFYSRPWLGLTTTGEEIDGECDFVIAHAQHGMLCVEVKGGTVSWDPLTDQWTSRDSYGITHRIKDPVAQARSSKHELLRKLKEVRGFENRWIRVRHGVIFPRCGAPARDLGPDRPLFIFCFAQQFDRDLSGWIHGRFTVAEERTGQEHGLGLDGVNALRDLLALPLTLRTPLGQIVRAEDRQLEYLTQQQYHLLLSIDSLERVCIQGGAGTGKTVLAAHHARSLADRGLRTLLVCYNEPLASRLSAQHRDSDRLVVSSFHSLCLKTLHDAHLPVPDSTSDPRRFFEEDLPAAVIDAEGSPLIRGFDAIIVDEGQDFRELWWTAVESLLASPGPRLLRIFYDANQRVYSGAAELIRGLRLAPIHLSWNLRNTRALHTAAYRYYSGREVTCSGPEGESPHIVVIKDETAARSAVGDVISNLINHEALDPEELAILVPDENWIQRLAPERIIAGFSVTDASELRAGCVTLDTVRRFKGLEACIVILIADARFAGTDELCYVALSRGRTRAFVIGPADCTRKICQAAP